LITMPAQIASASALCLQTGINKAGQRCCSMSGFPDLHLTVQVLTKQAVPLDGYNKYLMVDKLSELKVTERKVITIWSPARGTNVRLTNRYAQISKNNHISYAITSNKLNFFSVILKHF
jgi:hypothetical protein